MKYRSLKNWIDPDKLEGLVFFAQLLEELLFDYSLDTYKPSAMNTSTLCREALILIRDIENEVIDKSNLDHVLAEFVFNLKKDEVAISLLDIDIDTFTHKLVNKDNSLYEKRTILMIIHSQIKLKSYKEESEILLAEAIKDGNEKNRIRSLTRNYITALISMGYSSRFLYPNVRRVFHWESSKINSFEDINRFFKLVKGDDNNYATIFKGARLFEEIKDSCKELDIVITNSLENDYLEYANKMNFIKGEDETYIIIEDIKEKDIFSARGVSERRIEIISTLSNLFHHKEFPEWENKALVVNLETKKPRLINSSSNPMLMCSDSRAEDAARKLNKFINEFSFQEAKSFKKFFRATELHSLALRNDSPENQMLNLWVAVESLVPSKTSKNKSKIKNIIDSILPFISLDYIYMLTNKLMSDLKLWNITAFKKCIRKIPGENERDKTIRLLVLDKYKKEKQKLFYDLGNFYLLRNRVHYLSDCLSSVKNIEKMLDDHSERIGWQIRRIYRARNQVVHAGNTPNYIEILIKNLHDYLDIVTNGVVYLASEGEKINTVEQAFKYAEIKYDEYRTLLKNCDFDITEDNINKVLIDKRI